MKAYRYLYLVVILFMAISTFSCKKEAGDGGNSSIYGKVWVRDFNSTYTLLQDEYWAQDVDVYIIYGNDRSYSDRVRTNFDGTYEFKYLRPGDYHVFCYSEDSTLSTKALIPIIHEVTIDKKGQEVEAPQMTICK